MITSDELPKAVVPISLGNDRFSSENLVGALSAIVPKYRELTFIIADKIQLYNRAREVSDPTSFASVLEKFGNGEQLFRERRDWLRKVQTRLKSSIAKAEWKILSIDDLASCGVFRIFRNVLVAYSSLEEFRRDIDAAACGYVKRHITSGAEERSVLLSKAYMLEETAVSIALHIMCGIDDEYYIGTHLEPIIRLYAGGYGIDVFTLAGIPRQPRNWKFFSFDVVGKKWLEISESHSLAGSYTNSLTNP